MRKRNQGVKLIDEPIYSYWQALYMSYYSRRLYVDVIKHWRGFGFKYILLVLVLSSIPLAVKYISQVIHYFNDELIYPVEHMPLLMIQNGQVSIDEPVPYFVKSKSGKNIIEIDTRVDTRDFTKENKYLTTLITKRKFYFRLGFGQMLSDESLPEIRSKTSVHSFDKNDNEVFSGHDWVKTSGIKKWKFYGSLIAYPALIATLFSVFFMYNVVLSSIGRIISIVVLKHRMKFAQSFRLCCVASTPPLLPFIISLGLGYNLPNITLYYPLVVALYFSYGVLADKRYSKQLVRV